MVSPKISPVSPFFSNPALAMYPGRGGPDVERGASPGPSSFFREKPSSSPPSAHYGSASGRSGRRFMHRHLRLLLFIGAMSVTLGWYTMFGPGEAVGSMIGLRPPPAPPSDWGGGGGAPELGLGPGEVQAGWDDVPSGGHRVPKPVQPRPGADHGERPGLGAGLTIQRPKAVDPLTLEYEVDSQGHHRVTNDPYLARMHPDLSLLPAPSALFAEVQLPAYFRKATVEKFPDSRMRTIVSPTWDAPAPGSIPETELSPKSFAGQWVGPEDWDEPGQVGTVQWEGFKGARSGWETEAERMTREQRREAVRRGFAYAWQSYKDHAWGESAI